MKRWNSCLIDVYRIVFYLKFPLRLTHLFFLWANVQNTVGQDLGGSAPRFAEQNCVNLLALIFSVGIPLSRLSKRGRREIDSVATNERAIGNTIAAGGVARDLRGTVDIRAVGATIATPIDAL